VECIAEDVERVHFCVADVDALWVGARIKLAAHPQTGLRRRRGDEFDDGEAAGQRLAAPSLRDVAEQPMLYLVPLRRAGRKVTDLKRQAGLVGQFLQFDLEQLSAAARIRA
jgi:hypothetical protein